MNASTQQIVELAKRGFTEDQIEEALGLPSGTAATVLVKDASAMKALKLNDLESSFKNLEQAALDSLKVSLVSENDNVRLRAAELILKQRLGLLKPREHVTVNNNLNFLIQRQEAAKKLRDATVDV